jgi:hypothetical protein
MSNPYFLPPAAPAEQSPSPAVADAVVDAADGFDRERVLRLLDRLERDISTVEAAMEHAESGDVDSFTAAVAPLEARLAD